MADDRWLIVGLGNPGAEYAGNRHNAGYMVADLLAARMGARFKRDRSGAVVAAGRLSGRPVAALRSFYKIPAERVLVVHDDLDIPFGAIRLKLGGGDNGHNGLRSVTAALATRDYYRARVGIGRPPGRMDAAAFVLRDFSAAERKQLPGLIDRCADAVQALLAHGLAAAQNEFHPEFSPANSYRIPGEC